MKMTRVINGKINTIPGDLIAEIGDYKVYSNKAVLRVGETDILFSDGSSWSSKGIQNRNEETYIQYVQQHNDGSQSCEAIGDFPLVSLIEGNNVKIAVVSF